MAKETNIWFSKSHGSGEKEHFDTYRHNSDSSRTEKIDHTPVDKGEEVKIHTNDSDGDSGK